MQFKKLSILGIITAIILSLLVAYVIAQSNDRENSFKNDRIEVTAGWTPIFVFKTFAGKNLSQIAHTGQEGEICLNADPVGTTVFPAWMWNDSNKKWVIVQNLGGTIKPAFTPMEKFSGDQEWSLLWVNTKNDCTLGCGTETCMPGGRGGGIGT